PRSLFFLYAPAAPPVYTLSLHDALPICFWVLSGSLRWRCRWKHEYCGLTQRVNRLSGCIGKKRFVFMLVIWSPGVWAALCVGFIDRKSTRLNSSHVKISYAVFCLKKKNK